jgi:Tol biopolymer transport system component
VSITTNGDHANGDSITASLASIMSGNGRYVAFLSTASNLVPDDNNGIQDLFVRDRMLKTTSRISIGQRGEESNELPNSIAMTSDGNAIAFMSFADNLVPGDTNGTSDIFIYDLSSQTTRIVSVNQNGNAAPGDNSYPSVSANGRFVSFQSDANNLVEGDTNQVYDAFVKDMETGFVDRISVSSIGEQGNSHSNVPSISSNGRYAAFFSMASNLVEGDTNNHVDIFVFDRETRTTKLVSKTSDGRQSNGDSSFPTISGDGRYVVFNSDASNLVDDDTNGLSDYFWVDTVTNEIIKIPFNGPLATFRQSNYHRRRSLR